MEKETVILKIENLYKSFKQKKTVNEVLTDLNLEVCEGDIYGIIGLSGEGKSTLVRCINLLERPDNGKIIYQNKNVIDFSNKEVRDYRKEVSMIFQDFNLMNQSTVLKNVMLPYKLANGNRMNQNEMKEAALKLLDRVGLKDKANYYPSALSGGMKQRVAIARALASNPKILLCDECTSALDPTTANSILDLLQELNKDLGLTIIIIAHQMSVIERVCNKVAILSGHEIVEKGKLSDVFINPKTAIAKSLIYSDKINTKMSDEKGLRLTFDGNSDEPILALLIERCNVLVNIMYADTKVSEGKVYGQMIIKLPYYEEDVQKVKDFLINHGVSIEEVTI
ncbi:MAG: ATP-binding cassette domain-containing protein [Bacilli bacterium]|jgi:D-methionine transport system ATP-binding protein|nr:ATP-binding cassette domain-containing protein [Bacilli bacterium]